MTAQKEYTEDITIAFEGINEELLNILKVFSVIKLCKMKRISLRKCAELVMMPETNLIRNSW